MIGGIGVGEHALNALERVGVRRAGWQWIWQRGIEGGTFGPHRDIDRRIADDFDPEPGDDVNHAHCRCYLRPVLRDERGRFARGSAA